MSITKEEFEQFKEELSNMIDAYNQSDVNSIIPDETELDINKRIIHQTYQYFQRIKSVYIYQQLHGDHGDSDEGLGSSNDESNSNDEL